MPYAFLDTNGRKARYGVSYVRSICAQAGVGFQETSPDEDALAVDCAVEFKEANVRVQVKCTSTLTIAGRRASWPVEPGWVRKWAESLIPVYFVLVIVPAGDPTEWLDHRPAGTLHKTAAFWRRIDPVNLGSRIDVPKKQRLTIETLHTWRTEMLHCFTNGAKS